MQGTTAAPGAELPHFVTLATLREKCDEAEARRVFREISLAGGWGDLLAQPDDASGHTLALAGLSDERVKVVKEIFAGAKPKAS